MYTGFIGEWCCHSNNKSNVDGMKTANAGL